MATKRGYYREELERAVDNLEMALTHLSRIIDAYKDAHPEIAQTVFMTGEGLVTAAEVLKKIHDQI